MISHLNYIIVDPLVDHEWFKQFPKGEDMQLRLMCEGPEGSLFFFPKDYQITTGLERRDGHPITPYSPAYPNLEAIKAAIEEWAPLDERQRTQILEIGLEATLDLQIVECWARLAQEEKAHVP